MSTDLNLTDPFLLELHHVCLFLSRPIHRIPLTRQMPHSLQILLIPRSRQMRWFRRSSPSHLHL